VKDDSAISRGEIVLFLIWPFLALMLAIKSYRLKSFRNILWCFIIFYAYVLSVPTGSDDMDIVRRRDNFVTLSADDQMTFVEFKNRLFNEESWTADLVEPFLIFIVAQITTNYHILFLIYGVLFGFFYSRNICYVVDQLKGKLTGNSLTILITFSLLVAFWQINGFRFWFAAHVFFYGVITFLIEKKSNRIYLAFLTPLIHFSFLFAVIPLLIYLLLGNRMIAYFIIFFVSIFIAEIDMKFLEPVFSYLPGVIEKKATGYTSDYYAEFIDELDTVNLNWYAAYKDRILNVFVVIVLVLSFLFNREFARSRYYSIISFTLLFMGVSQIFKSIPSMDRFLTVGYLFAFTFILLFSVYNNQAQWFKLFCNIFVWGLVLWSIVEIRNGFDTISIASVFSNFFFAPFLLDINFSLIDIFK
jgi:hypothetical protein